MTMKWMQRGLALFAASVLLLSACSQTEKKPEQEPDSGALTWSTWNGYNNFLKLLNETCPEIELEYDVYSGANYTGFSWAQMRADDIPDIFITTQILDEELAKERLADLSSYDMVNRISTSILDQVAIDGGVYLLPVDYAMYGILYNKTLMEEHGWALPTNFAELEALCEDIRAEGLIPGVLGTQLTGNTFSAVFNLAKTSWLTTPEGVNWERDFLAGDATAAGRWEDTMDFVQRYIDIGMFTTDPEDRNNPQIVLDYLGQRKSVFCTAVLTLSITQLPDTGDELGMMPFISEDGSKNIYMYSPTSYIGISKRLTEPGNEKKLEDAVKLLSLLYSPEGQAAFITQETPCLMSVLSSAGVPEDALIYDAQQAVWKGRAFPMTYVGWDGVLADMGQAYKDWFRGEGDMDGPACITRMDELQNNFLSHSEQLYFCRSTADFTQEETARLVGKALGSAVGADAVMVPVGTFYREGAGLKSCVTGKLYEGRINTEVSATILPAPDGEYGLGSMTGAQVRELVQTGFDAAGDGKPFPYILVTRGDRELEEDRVYKVAFLMGGYTGEVEQACSIQKEKGSIRGFMKAWLQEQKTVSPEGNPWE
ncbi:MAG: carbohydrate ABC transporter substrate-binding protein [Lawsonibacter sp.]|nr:carbohydrate ABC transporter substrate-binding protein [Lawsonibacter sp.]